nr:retrovirus-related Pol polyprotein from transposon TNT 1-94 [Tanacetum cinerariifolium]
MAIVEDEPSVGKANARSGQWVDITMKKVHILLSMTDGDERKHVLDYTHFDLHCVEDQRKTWVNLENGSLKDEIIDLKRKVEGKRKSPPKRLFSLKMMNPHMCLHLRLPDSEFECDSQKPLLPLPKLMGAAPSGTSGRVISLSDLTLNMDDLTLDTLDPKKTRPFINVSPAYVIKKKTEKYLAGPNSCSDKKADSSTEQLLITLM